MNPILKLIVDSLLKYIEKHPDQIEILVKALLDFIVEQVKKNQLSK